MTLWLLITVPNNYFLFLKNKNKKQKQFKNTFSLQNQCLVTQGLGITVFGMAYMFVHDGLVHRRFPVGPIANVPYFRRVAAAHQVSMHHHTHDPSCFFFFSFSFFCFFLNFQLNPTAWSSDAWSQLHHSDKFNGVPYGLFLGPKVSPSPFYFFPN